MRSQQLIYSCICHVVDVHLQIDHIEQNVQDVMSRYSPCVPPHRYTINFVPVIDKNEANCDITKAVLFDPRFGLCLDIMTHFYLPIISYMW